MNRPVVIVDLDNVVYPWTEMMSEELWRLAGVKVEMGDYRTWSVWNDWGVPKGLFDWVWEQSIREGVMYATGLPLSGAVDALWEISDMEYHIHIATARLNKFRLHDKAVESTVKWLKRYAIPYRSLSFTEDKSLLSGEAIIDDNPKNIETSPARNKILFPAPHNEKKAMTPQGGWDQVVAKLGGAIY